MSGQSQVAAGGILTGGLLGVLLIGLKLTGFIDWSWWWVTAPFWIAPVAVIGLLVAVIIVAKSVEVFCDLVIWLRKRGGK